MMADDVCYRLDIFFGIGNRLSLLAITVKQQDKTKTVSKPYKATRRTTGITIGF